MDNDTGGKKFSTSQEEIIFWRDLAEKLKTELEECKEELEEYQISSRELETELETQVLDLESTNKELTANMSKLKVENESLKEKLSELHVSSHQEISKLEDEYQHMCIRKNELHFYVRKLEQENDDLERWKRSTDSTLEDFEYRLNQAIERNVILESELDDKESLRETIQRLKDEARDLRQELKVKRRTITSDSFENSPSINSPNSVCPSALKVKPVQVVTGIPADDKPNNFSMTPSARISALNIVNDIVGKICTIESRLSSCRRLAKDSRMLGRLSSDNLLTSARNRRSNTSHGQTIPKGQAL